LNRWPADYESAALPTELRRLDSDSSCRWKKLPVEGSRFSVSVLSSRQEPLFHNRAGLSWRKRKTLESLGHSTSRSESSQWEPRTENWEPGTENCTQTKRPPGNMGGLFFQGRI